MSRLSATMALAPPGPRSLRVLSTSVREAAARPSWEGRVGKDVFGNKSS